MVWRFSSIFDCLLQGQTYHAVFHAVFLETITQQQKLWNRRVKFWLFRLSISSIFLAYLIHISTLQYVGRRLGWVKNNIITFVLRLATYQMLWQGVLMASKKLQNQLRFLTLKSLLIYRCWWLWASNCRRSRQKGWPLGRWGRRRRCQRLMGQRLRWRW